ncbi:MAG TPA: hypothetical protein DDW30_09820 [Clostridiales bacterium]|nr:hypothetical protein [Clostridiales bacterium]
MQNDEYKDPYATDDENAGAGEQPPNQSRWDDVPDPFEDAEPKRRGDYGDDNRGAGQSSERKSASRGTQSGSSRKSTGSRTGGSSRAKNNSDSGSKSGKKGGKTPVNLKESPSAKPVHRIVPCLMFAFAVFLFVCMFLHLVSGENANSAATHPVGAVGYGICFAFFGLFGGGGFLLPVLLGYLAVMWRRLLDRHKLIEKAVTSVLLQLLLSTFIHSCALGALEKADRYMPAGELIRIGAKMQGGGLFGGGIGYFLCSRMNIFGAIFISVLLLLVGTFFFIGTTPQHLIASIRAKVIIAKAKRKKDDTDEMDSAPIMDRMSRKHERAAGRRTDPEDDMPEPPEGAVVYPNGKPTPRAVVRSKESLLLTDEDNPVPVMPILNASDETPPDSPLFVPEEIGRELKQESDADKSATDTSDADRSAASAKAAPSAQNAQSTQGAQNAQNAAQPVRMRPQVSAMRQADSAAVDHVFPPQPNDRINAARRVQKSDQGFELGSIFVSGPDAEIPRERVHVPLPPEVPLPGSAPRGERENFGNGGNGGMQTPVARPAQGAVASTPANRPIRPTDPTVRLRAGQPVGPSGTLRPNPANRPAAAQNGMAGAPSASGAVGGPSARPNAATSAAAAHQPTLRQATAKGPQDFGMTSEELDAKESATMAIDRAIAAKKNGGAPRPERTPVKADPRPVPPPQSRPYTFPPISYLQAGEAITEQTKGELEGNAQRIADKLKTFHIDINEITYSCGPTVTRYEVFPASNVRVRTVLNMDKDIALAFGVKDVRMDSMEGKSAIGIEVPNKNRSTVYLRNMIEAKEFADNQTPLFCCLGDDVAGSPVYFSIPKMPHLLVAGATNSGKSVCINCIVMSILYKMRPDEVRLVMIDPKKVEFAPYQGIPHLLAPIITTPKDASGALQAAVNEMESRFDRIADVGARNIDGYNKIAAGDAGLAPMSRIVIIIDELADLMMVAKNEVEDSICRLLQKARAAGIYLIIGTQRPSVDVITGLLKANIPSRIACTVASVVDSKTILDRGGAEKLLGKGDMLFNPTGAKEPIRVQGAFLSDGEVEKICEFVRATNGTAHYDESFTKLMKEYSAQSGKKGKEDAEMPEGGDGGMREDPKYAEAVRVAVEQRQISTSMLQRKIGVGYARGAKLVDRMEAEGIVTPQDGSKPREVLMTAEQYIERFVDNKSEDDGEE